MLGALKVFVYDFAPIIQVIAFLGAGVAATKYIDNKISALEKRLNVRIDKVEQKLDGFYALSIQQPLKNEEFERRISLLEDKIGEIAQKAQMIVGSRDLEMSKKVGVI
jgi:prefoldin subunit 5